MTRLNGLDRRAPTLSSSAVRIVGAQILESTGTAAGTYISDIYIPAYARLLDVQIHNEEVWDAASSATLVAGLYLDAAGVISTEIDANGIYTDTNVKATDLTKGQSLAFARVGGVAGALLTEGSSSHYLNLTVDDPFWVRIKVTTVGAVGTLGETYVYVTYAVPELDVAVFAAT